TGRGDEAVALAANPPPDPALHDVQRPGVDGIEAAAATTETPGTAVVLLTAFSHRELIERATEAGAMAYLVKPYQRADLVPAIETALARYRETVALAAKADDLADQLEVRKLVDRAKGVLMDSHGLAEAEAFRFLQTEAMSHRRTMADVASEVIAGTLAP
ncbi:MAG: ANTAR domain-containing protein, partial [Actinomycetota bacterium]